MSTKNLIKKENKFDKEYIAEIVSNDDPLRNGRLLVKVDALMGDIPFWVDSTLLIGQVNFIVIPEAPDTVTVKFKNKDIYSGEWSVRGNTTSDKQIDPKKYGLSDTQGNFMQIDRGTDTISINSTKDYNLTVGQHANISIVGNATINVQGNCSSTITGDCSNSIQGSCTNSIQGNCTNTISGSSTSTISGDSKVTCANVELTASSVNVHASSVNLGDGGKQIARLGDKVQVVDRDSTHGGTWEGTIISAGTNTSI